VTIRPEVKQEIVRHLLDGKPINWVARRTNISEPSVRAIRRALESLGFRFGSKLDEHERVAAKVPPEPPADEQPVKDRPEPEPEPLELKTPTPGQVVWAMKQRARPAPELPNVSLPKPQRAARRICL